MSATDANKDFALGQKGTSFEVKPTNNDDPNNVIPLDLTDYESAKIRIRQPNGKISTHEAVVTGASETTSLIGLRIDDPGQTIDDTHINDGNDGVVSGGSTTNISLSPLNDADKTTYVEIPPGATLTFDDGASSFEAGFKIWAFFQGQPNAKIIIRLHDIDGTVSFQSNEIGPNASNDAIDSGTTTTTAHRATQSIENTGTETAYYAGWSGRADGTVPTGTGIRTFTNGIITTYEVVRPFTSVRVEKGKTLILKRDIIENSPDHVLLYVRGVALPSIRLDSYLNNTLQGSRDIFDVNDDVIRFRLPSSFNELHIEVLDDTNGAGIELGGVSIDDGFGSSILPRQITDWTEALITTPAIFPFDENLNTETQLTDGVWFFESIGTKTVKQIAITRPVGTTPNPDVEVQVLINGEYVRVGSYTPELTDDTPSLIPINDVPRSFEHLRLVSTASFQLHELDVQGVTMTNLVTPTIEYIDSEGILTQLGAIEYWADIYFKDGTRRPNTSRQQAWVV